MRNFRWCQRRHYICTLPWIARNYRTQCIHNNKTWHSNVVHVTYAPTIIFLSDANTITSMHLLSNCMQQLRIQNALILYIMAYNWVILCDEVFHYAFVKSSTSSIKIISSLDAVLLALVCSTLFCYHYRNLNEMPPSQSIKIIPNPWLI